MELLIRQFYLIVSFTLLLQLTNANSHEKDADGNKKLLAPRPPFLVNIDNAMHSKAALLAAEGLKKVGQEIKNLGDEFTEQLSENYIKNGHTHHNSITPNLVKFNMYDPGVAAAQVLARRAMKIYDGVQQKVGEYRTKNTKKESSSSSSSSSEEEAKPLHKKNQIDAVSPSIGSPSAFRVPWVIGNKLNDVSENLTKPNQKSAGYTDTAMSATRTVGSVAAKAFGLAADTAYSAYESMSSKGKPQNAEIPQPKEGKKDKKKEAEKEGTKEAKKEAKKEKKKEKP